MGFATSRLCGNSYMVSDQKALTGGSWSGTNRKVYLFAPVSGAPAESLREARIDRLCRRVAVDAEHRARHPVQIVALQVRGGAEELR